MFAFFRGRSQGQKQQQRKPLATKRRLRAELLEDRYMLTTFAVTSLGDTGAGTLRQAIINADAASGASIIDFSISGTIALTSAALPAITANIDIAGSSAPGFTSAPTVEVNFGGFSGLVFNAGSAGSTLQSLSLVNAAGSGVTLSGTGAVTVESNYIGLALNGTTVVANTGDGITITNSTGDTIGGPVAADANVISGNGGNGITINSGSSTNTVSGNTIGLTATGNVAAGNQLDGIEILGASNNVIGNTNPVSSTTYNNIASVNLSGGGTAAVTAWQGLRGGDSSGQYIETGTSGNNGLLYEGTLAGVGTGYTVMYPSSFTSSVYGPNNLGGGNLQLVGSYKNSDFQTAPVTVNGFIYQGTTSTLTTAADYTTIDYPGAEFNYVHSTSGGLAVGNFDNPAQHGQGTLPLGPGNAYVYDVASQSFVSVAFPGSLSNTAYGIWYNGGTSYTIVGGYSASIINNLANQNEPIGQGYIVDYDSSTGVFSNWASVSSPAGGLVHFEGISSTANGTYTLAADAGTGGAGAVSGSLVTIVRNADGSFGTPTWSNLTYTGAGAASGQTITANSVYGSALNGIVTGGSTFAYTATVNQAFQLSNVISGNGANGIELNGATSNQVAQNYIGTDSSGTLARANGQNGILITANSASNMIGGVATGGNDPTNSVFVRPPSGNLISGNMLAGVLINGGSTLNQLSGNYIGTTASGNAALGNVQDGVKISSANNNSLIGCGFQQNPFVYYNVISGNGGNGLYVLNSNGTTIQANFFGIGADNQHGVGNTLNGVLVAGTSAETTMGGPIPLGNVDSDNGQNGVVVQDTASYFTSYNTFTGTAAFSLQTNLGNGRDGMLITTSGAGILIRTCIISENHNDGVEIGGNATGVQVTGNIIGLNSNGLVAMGNKHDGVEVDGTSHNDVIGGPQLTGNVVPQNTISGNSVDGVAIDGAAYGITVSNSFIGTDVTGKAARPNGLTGLYIASGSSGNTIGSVDPTLLTVISGNLGNGIDMGVSSGNVVVGSYIGVDSTGAAALPNGGNGVYIGGGANNSIGSRNTTIPHNVIADNGAFGVDVWAGTKNGIHNNSIFGNGNIGIKLMNGGNQSQVPPVLTSVHAAPGGTQITGTMTGANSTTYTLEFFANTASGATGQYLLGSALVTTSSTGVASFITTVPTLPTGATWVTATATDPVNNTSQFSTPVVRT